MCKYYGTIANPRDHRAYVLYNLLFSGDQFEFTAQDVVTWLEEYGIRLSVAEVRDELSAFVRSGLLYSYIDGYEVVGPRTLRASA